MEEVAEALEHPQAVVREVDGQLVLDDPHALAMAKEIARHNCRALFEANAERVRHFVARAKVLGRSAGDVVIVLLNVDDVHGGPMAEALMPGHDWQVYRDRGEVPIARGLAGLEGIQEMLDLFDEVAAADLRALSVLPNICTVVVDHGVAAVFRAEDVA